MRKIVDSVPKGTLTLSLRFLGALPGEYSLHLSQKILGTINSDNLGTLDVNGYITNISPASGSPYGGFNLMVEGYALL